MSRRPPRFGYWPLAAPFLVAVAVVAMTIVLLVALDVVTYAYQRIGLDREWLFAILLGSILASRINIPIARFPDRAEVHLTDVVYFGVRYRVPATIHTGTTTLAINVGGALIPGALSAYLIIHDALGWRALLAIACVSAVVRMVARPVNGIGIATPMLLPPLAAAIFASAIAIHAVAGLAYVSGTLGTLVGADLLNLGRIRDLGAPVASIGGAGTFDGIFLTGILAVLLVL